MNQGTGPLSKPSQDVKTADLGWVYSLKKRMLFFLTLTILGTMVVIGVALNRCLMNDSTIKTQMVSDVITTSLKGLMLKRAPEMIQEALENIRTNKDSIERVFIVDKTGRVVYSSHGDEIGRVFDADTEPACRGCHIKRGELPSEATIVTRVNGNRVHRNVEVIHNEKPCYTCHPESDTVVGKLIIDRSLKGTYKLIALIESITLGLGLVMLGIMFPFMSKRVDQYISEIFQQSAELSLLNSILERLSRTIDMEELKRIVLEIVGEAFEADETDLALFKGDRRYTVTSWVRDQNKVIRRNINHGSMQVVLNDWLDGRLTEWKLSDNGKEIYVPIVKGEDRLGLIAAKKTHSPFNLKKLTIIRAMASHIAVAIDNALLYVIAITDELTGLFTYRHFRQSIEKRFYHASESAEDLTLLMLDIDDFKKVNDTYGHVVGDTVLREVANWICRSVRDTDLAFRYGGEEFAVCLPATSIEGGYRVAERIRQNIESAVLEPEHDIRVTISIGLSSYPSSANSVEELICTADKALLEAKAVGKNRVAKFEVKPVLSGPA